uniref:single-stranded-DNA-specific exonuclease RecJ n=1 Tax=Ornithobacterium rhinotracheale TaxID=28251 RepID=UPI0039A5A2A1
MSSRWLLKPKPLAENVKALQDSLKISESLSRILVQRGITTYDEAKDFFRPQLSHLHDPLLMKDMDKAVARILQALQGQEKIMVYGDYDVDGTTSVALMYTFLKKQTEHITYYIPDRYKEGYGVSREGIDYAADNDIQLIISLDCGIKANEMVNYAKEKGIDFIICDHHFPGEKLPEAIAVLDPKREDCQYPYDGLSGCGVGFKLIQALAKPLKISDKELFSYLDLVAVSIAADIVPITGENRTLAHFGLKIINSAPRLGLKMLIPKESVGLVNVSKIVFAIAPKINAAGRIKQATDAVKLLITENEITARRYVSEINNLNKERKELDSLITDEALNQLAEEDETKFTTVVYDPHWHKGVIGIVASRLTEVYYRPTAVFTQGDNGMLVASVRSVKGFDVYEALVECGDLLERFGGHMSAAGLTMKEVNFPNFKRRFEQIVSRTINKAQQTPTIEIDTELSFKEITPKFARILKQMEPFGPENLMPHFLTRGVRSAGDERYMGRGNEHIKLTVYHPEVRKHFTAIGFGMGHHLKRMKTESFDMVYVIEENVWQGKAHLQIRIKDVRFG